MDEWVRLRARLLDAGIAGGHDLGRFVSNPEFFGSSAFDERAAMPILIEALPHLTDPKLVRSVAGHLRRPWARPDAFDALLNAFETWAAGNTSEPGWHLGDALGTAATTTHVSELLRISRDVRFGESRQMVVSALGRFRKVPEVRTALLGLIADPDVALHAMRALRRVLGPKDTLPHLERIEQEHRGTQVGEQAAREAKKVRQALAQAR